MLMQEMQKHWGTVFGGDRLETKQFPQGLRSQGTRVCGLEQTEATPWSWALAEKSDLKQALFRKGAPRSEIFRPAFWQVIGAQATV